MDICARRRFSYGAWTVVLGALVVACGARTSLEGPAIEGEPVEPRCGNGLVEGDEACDDANTREEDGCLSSCVAARCGDGVVADFEGCDDGNTDDGDACRADCTLPRCGDGLLDPGEDCDDGGVLTASCTPLCRAHRCGDGFVEQGVEACDDGAANADRPALVALQGDLREAIRPLSLPGESAASFYDYRSASAHTGLEASGVSRLFFTLEANGALSLFTLHGIDDEGSSEQPSAKVGQRFEGLPPGTEVTLADDKASELSIVSEGVAVGDWKFDRNTDGGILGGLPFPGSWAILVTSTFEEGIESWEILDAGSPEAALSLDPGEGVLLLANAEASSCSTTCTIPRCGDGVLDAGERCDDGNEVSGDGCRADCSGIDGGP